MAKKLITILLAITTFFTVMDPIRINAATLPVEANNIVSAETEATGATLQESAATEQDKGASANTEVTGVSLEKPITLNEDVSDNETSDSIDESNFVPDGTSTSPVGAPVSTGASDTDSADIEDSAEDKKDESTIIEGSEEETDSPSGATKGVSETTEDSSVLNDGEIVDDKIDEDNEDVIEDENTEATSPVGTTDTDSVEENKDNSSTDEGIADLDNMEYVLNIKKGALADKAAYPAGSNNTNAEDIINSKTAIRNVTEVYDSINIMMNDEMISEAVLKQNGKLELSLNYNINDQDIRKYQWQVLADDTWFNIYDQNKKDSEFTYAMIAGMLSDGGQALVRAYIETSDVRYYSNEVCVTVSYVVTQNDMQNKIVVPEVETSSENTIVSRVFSLFRSALYTASVPEYVTVKINYQFEDGTKAFDPYVATLKYGLDFNAVVPSPTVIGYDPYINDDEDAKTVTLDYYELKSDQELTVVYKPSTVGYSIKYYLQNISDDGYTEDPSLYRQNTGLTGSYPSGLDIEIEGFTSLYHQPETIAADGSTVFECYYDRNYYLINFKLNGGYGVEPIYARYQTYFIVNNPTKQGYTFVGWDKDGDGIADALPTTMPSEDQTYEALWTKSETQFTVAYWLENADEAKYDFWASYKVDATSGDVINGENYKDYSAVSSGFDTYEMRYSYYDHADTNVIVEGDGSTVVNVYYNRNRYDLKFYYAMASLSGGTPSKYYVIGGTTYYFGTYAGSSARADEVKLLDQYMSSYSSNRGQVTALPELNDIGKSRNYTLGYDTSTVSSTSYNYYYITFNAKYGANLENLWPCNVFESADRSTANSSSSWTGTKAYVSAWNGEHHVYYTQNNENQTVKGNYNKFDYQLLWDYSSYGDSGTVAYLCFWENGADIGWSIPRLFIYNIFVPQLDGVDYSNEVTRTHNGVNYYLRNQYYTCDDSQVATNQTAPSITGFEKIAISSSDMVALTSDELDAIGGDYANGYNMYFYYTRNSNTTLTFNNVGTDIATYTIPYETNIADKYFVPDYPTNLEEGAYEFGGWYTTPECLDGTEFVFNENTTMPAHNIILYAKWSKLNHTVNVYPSYDDMVNKTNLIETQTVLHGNVIMPLSEPTSADYEFVGWFFVKDGQRTAFNMLEQPITYDMDIYAEWSSDKTVTYTVNYKKQGTDELIATETFGRIFAGMTRTFTAKSGTQLFDDYQAHWYPLVSSHSILMNLDSSLNTYDFEYVYLEEVPYTVRYVDKATGASLIADKYVADNTQAMVTEKFQPISGYISDTFYKRLTVSANIEQNVITFYYTADTTHANYAVHHYIENADGTGYTEYSVIEGIGDINATISATPLTISGFTYNSALSSTSGKVTEDGLELNLYYDREEYSYTVKFLEYGTDTELATAITGTANYGSVIQAYAEVINGYTVIGDQARSMTIDSIESQNIIKFYYQAKEIVIKYEAVGPTDAASFGNVSISQEIITGTNTPTGAIPIAEKGYAFVGWFIDDQCTQPVNASWVNSDDRLIPVVTDNATFYALFESLYADLTINTENTFTHDKDQIFIFNIKGTDTTNADIDINVTIKTNGSTKVAHLPVGSYTVTQLNDWSFRYDTAAKDITLNADTTNELTFSESRAKDKWLDGNYNITNQFATSSN